MDFWLSDKRQLMVNLTVRPVHCGLSMWEKEHGFSQTLYLKKKEVEWLSKALREVVKKMEED